MIYSIKRFSALDEERLYSIFLEEKLFASDARRQRREEARAAAKRKPQGPSALDKGIAGFEQGMTSLGTSMGKGITAVGSVLGKAGSAIGQGASAVGRAAQSAGQSIMSGVGAVGRGVKSGATSVGQALGKAGTSTGKAIQTAGQGIGRAAQSVGSGISGAFRSVGNLFRRKPTTISVMTPEQTERQLRKISRDNWVLQQAGVTDLTKLSGKERQKALAQARAQSRSTGDKRELDLGSRGSVLTPQDGSSYGGFKEQAPAKRFAARKEEMLARLTPKQREEFFRKGYIRQQETAMIAGRTPIPQGYQFPVLAQPGGGNGGSQSQAKPTITGNGTQQAAQPKPAVASQPQPSPSPQVSTNNTTQTTQPKPATTSGTGGVTQQPAQSKPAEVPQPQKPQSGSTGGSQSQPQAQPNPAQPAQPKPQVTGGGTQQAQPKPAVQPQQPAQQGRVGQWFKNAGQKTWNGVKTAGKIGMIGGTAAAGLGAYALYKTATSDSDD